MPSLSVFGLGKVGLTLAACLADAGFRVTGLDVNAELVEGIRRDPSATTERGVPERVRQHLGGNLTLTCDPQEAIRNSEITFVIVPTPSNTLGGFSVRYVKSACDTIGAALREKSGYHVVAIVSTMLPGSSEHVVMPYLEQASDRTMGDNLGYCYNPAFIALGEVVNGFIHPNYVLIGESDKKAGDAVQTVLDVMVQNAAPVARMLPIEAEITKIASNTYETMRVSFANMLFSMCNEIPGANVDRITGALSHRMGKRFFRGAVPYGGPCWPRDNIALSAFMDALGVPSIMPRTVDAFNAEHGKYLLRKILEMTRPGDRVGLLGLAYKPNTPVVERSFAVELAGWLVAEGREVIAWDPLAIPTTRAVLGDRIAYAATGNDCIAQAQVAVLINPLCELRDLDWSAVGNRTIVDCWRCLLPEETIHLADYRPLGIGPEGPNLLDRIDAERLRLLTD